MSDDFVVGAFSSLAMLTNLFNLGDSFAYRRLSDIFRALSPNAFSASWFSSSRTSGSLVVFGANTRRCYLCLAVACDSGLTYFRLNMTNTCSRVCRLGVLILRNVCRAFSLNSERKWLNFFCSDISGCMLIIVWNRSSNS